MVARAGRRGQQQVAQVARRRRGSPRPRPPPAAGPGCPRSGAAGCWVRQAQCTRVEQPAGRRRGPGRAMPKCSRDRGLAGRGGRRPAELSAGSRSDAGRPRCAPRNSARARCDGSRGSARGSRSSRGTWRPASACLALGDPGGQRRRGRPATRAARRAARRPRRSARSGSARAPSSAACRRRPTPRSGVDEGRGLGLRVPASDRRAARRPAAPGRPRGRSAPWCGASACRAGRGLRAAAWSRPRAISARSSGVSLPCSVDAPRIAARRSSSSRR